MSIVISCSCCILRNNSSEFELNFQTLSLYMAFSVIAILYVANHAESCRNVACLYLWCSSQLSQLFSYYLLLSLISFPLSFCCECPFIPFSVKWLTSFCGIFHKVPVDSLSLFFVACLFCVCVLIWLDPVQTDKILIGFSRVDCGMD